MTKAKEYTEELNDDELGFLQQMESKDKKMYYKVYNILMIMSFVIPFIGSWYRAFDGAPNAFSLKNFYLTAGVLLAISTAATYGSYWFFLRNVQLDIKHRSKTIEICHIMRKQYVPQSNKYYFYIDSANKLSIEVSEEYYYVLGEGDEVNLEFTTHSRHYLGYF